MKIYIDKDYKCHVTDDGTMIPIETNFFDLKSTDFIEGYRYVPKGETWIREDGVAFTGEMITPWKDFNELNLTQRIYEKQLLTEYVDSLRIMGVEV